MNFSKTINFDRHTQKICQYRRDYLEHIIEKYCNTDEPDYIIDIQTLKIVEYSENVRQIPKYGELSDYYCEPAQKLINKMMTTLSTQELSQKSKRKGFPIQSKKRKGYLRSKRKEKRHVYQELDKSIHSKNLTCNETSAELTKKAFICEDVPIDPCSSIYNSLKNFKHTKKTLLLDETIFCKSEILCCRKADVNEKEIKSELYFKHKSNAYSQHLSVGALDEENSSLSLTSSNTLSKDDSICIELKNKFTNPPKIERLKNKQSEKLDIANKQIVTKAADHTAVSIPASQNVNNSHAKIRWCQVSCTKLDLNKYEMPREGSFILNNSEMTCSDNKSLHKIVNGAKNSSNIILKHFNIYPQPRNQFAQVYSKSLQDKLFSNVNHSNTFSNNDSPKYKKTDTVTEQKVSKYNYHDEISCKIAIPPKDFENCHEKRSKTKSFLLSPLCSKFARLKVIKEF